MPTQTEQEQAKEFLKRAEIRTMKKDLSKLREDDSLKERDKIAHIKTLEEQQQEHQKQLEAQEQARQNAEKLGMQEVLQRNKKQEYKAEKDIKNYGAIEVIGKLKKVKYGYYIGEFIEKCKNDEVING